MALRAARGCDRRGSASANGARRWRRGALLAVLGLASLVGQVLAGEGAAFIGPPALDPAGDPASQRFIGPPEPQPFAILGAELEPGTRHRLNWNADMNFSGANLNSPATVVHGVRPGPVLCLVAGVHGDELNGIELARRMAELVDPEDLGGTLIAVPVVNLFGFLRNSRYLPDRRDLNRHFPGSAYGSVASRIAHAFLGEVLIHCDAVVDLHTGSFDRRNLPQVRADLSRPEVVALAHGFGATSVLHSQGSRGMLRVALTEAGVPAVTFEVGGPNQLEPVALDHGERALQGLLHHLGMTRHRPSWNIPQPIFYESTWVRSDGSGMLLSQVELGELVEPGQVLGKVIDPVGEEQVVLRSPIRGTVIGMARNQSVLPGYATFHLGRETSEQQVVREALQGSPGIPDEEGPDGSGGEVDEH